MSAQVIFQCPQCAHTESLTLDEFREVGFPLCPVHKVPMISQQKDAHPEVSQAVGEILSGVTRLAAAALTAPTREMKQSTHE